MAEKIQFEAIHMKTTERDAQRRRALGIRWLAQTNPDKYGAYYHNGRLKLTEVGWRGLYRPTGV